MPQQSSSEQNNFGRDVQRTESDAARESASNRSASQTGSSANHTITEDERNRQANQYRQSLAERSATKATATRNASTSETKVTTPLIEGRNVTREDVFTTFSLEIDIEIGNLTDPITRT